MAREFGKRSYKPEEISFVSSGNQPSGLPFSAVTRKAPVNILCEASNNACTAGELAIALGIALPYMEEEIALLEKAELLTKTEDGKYLTNFFISPKECRSEMNSIVCDYSEKNHEAIWRLARTALEKAKELGVNDKTVGDIDAQMYFAFYIEQHLFTCTKGLFNKFKRADGGNWGFIGFENGAECRLPKAFFSNNRSNAWGRMYKDIGSNGYYCENGGFGTKVYTDKDSSCPEGRILFALDYYDYVGHDAEKLSSNDKKALDYAVETGYVRKAENGEYIPAMLVFSGDAMKTIMDAVRTDPEYGRVRDECAGLTAAAKDIITRYSMPRFCDDYEYYTMMSLDTRSVMSRLWLDRGLYTGGHCQFAALIKSER